MRKHTLASGTVIDLDKVVMVEPLSGGAYDVHFSDGFVITLWDATETRAALITAWEGI